MSTKKILHLFHDDKFFDDAFDLFDKLNGYQNIYLIHKKDREFKYLKKTNRLTVITSKKEYLRYISSTNADFAFIHSMYGNTMKVVLLLPLSVKVIWSSMGYDLYGSKYSYPPLNIELYMPITKSIIQKKESIKERITLQIRRLFGGDSIQKKAINRVDFCSTVCENEFLLLKRLPYFRAKPFYWNYPFKDKFFESKKNNIDAMGIVIGNSASYTNNHIDIFKLLSGKIKSRTITIPLSYGDPDYIQIVKDNSFLLMENHVIPLTEFLPFDEYMKIQDNCGFAIYGHIRQQALGNIIIMLYIGVKVFINSDSVLFQDLKNIGFIFKDIHTANLIEELSHPLSESERQHNRDLIYKLYSNSVKLQKVQECFDTNCSH